LEAFFLSFLVCGSKLAGLEEEKGRLLLYMLRFKDLWINIL
jgi:hypothetical protein